MDSPSASTGSFIRLLSEGQLAASVATETAAGFLADLPRTLAAGEGESAGERVSANNKPSAYEDVTEGELLPPELRSVWQKHGFRGAVVVPLLVNDHPLGRLVVIDKRVHRFTDDEVSLLTAFADQASLALEKARLLNEAEREKERLTALNEVGNRLAGAHDTDDLLDLIVNEAARLVSANGAFIRLLDGGLLVPSAATKSLAAVSVATLAAN